MPKKALNIPRFKSLTQVLRANAIPITIFVHANSIWVASGKLIPVYRKGGFKRDPMINISSNALRYLSCEIIILYAGHELFGVMDH